MSNWLIKNALIIPMTDRSSFAGYARVRGGAITKVEAGVPPGSDETEEVIDGTGCALMPGLINAHTHLYQVLLRAVWEDLELMPWLKRIYGCARVLRPEHFYAGSLLGCVEAIRSGVTTLCEHNFLNPSPECAFETIRAIKDAGVRAVWEDLELMPWLKRIYGCARVLRPEHFYAGSLLGCVEAIRSGVTTLCEHNFLNPSPECGFETIRAIKDAGVRAVFARTIMDTGEIVPECTKEKPEEAFRRIEEILAHHTRGEQLQFMTGPNTPPINTTPGLLKEIRRFADDKSLGISAHVAESKSVVECVRREHGKNGVVEFLHEFGILGPNSIFAHSVHISKDEIGLLKQTGSSVSHNPVSNMMLGDGVAPVVEMLRQGVNVALGTDGAASNHSQDLFDTMKAASLLQKVHHQDAGVIDPYSILRMATVSGAKALGLDSICGTIEVGKRADLILVDMNTIHNQPVNDIFSQIVHCAKASDVRTVMVNGELLMRDRKLVQHDEVKLVADAKEANRDLMDRVNQLSF